MKKMFFTFLLLTQYLMGFSKFYDDFSDGNFTSNPNWIGDLGVFEVDASYKLHLIDNNCLHSSASTVGFGTTTYKSSQQLIIESIGEITIEPNSFSPNNEGYKDICSISWSFNETNLTPIIKAFDGEERLVKNILNNKMIGNNGSVNWDGTDVGGLLLKTGMHIIWLEAFLENVNVERFKKVVVLSR